MLMRIPSPNASKTSLSLLLLLMVSLALGPGSPAPLSAQAPPATGSEAKPARDIILTGKLVCSLKRAVIVPFHGVITALLVQAGQRVAKNAVLARYRFLPESVVGIQARLFPATLKELELTQTKLVAKRNELEKKREGLRHLAQKKLASQQSLDQIEAELRLNADEMKQLAERLAQQRQLHEDDLILLKKQLGSLEGIKHTPSGGKLAAPINGNVVWINPDIRPDAEVKPGDTAFMIGNLDTMIVKTQVHELEAMRLQPGDQAEVSVVSLPEKKFTATLSRISWSSVNIGTDQPAFFEVEFSVSNPEHILKDGLRVTLKVPKASQS